MKVVHSRDDQVITEVLAWNTVKLSWKFRKDSDCPPVPADDISVFKTDQMCGVSAETYSTSERKCGWIFSHISYLLLTDGTFE